MNLFDLFVKIGVDDQASKNVSKISQNLGNGLKTAAKVGAAAVSAAAAAITALTTQALNSFAEYEQLAGGAQKIFDQMDYSQIAADANNAYKELGLSASQYLAVINDVGATFAATMGDEAGYEAAKTGLKAISDYASGTGKNVDELSQKFTLITRSTSSYQSIADQFSGILPATSAGFLEQAQAAGILSEKYKQLTEVPIDEYQAAVSKMLEKGVADLGLANNTVDEAFSTLSGSLSMTKGAWSNLVTGLADDSADLDMLIGNFVESVDAVVTLIIPKIETALSGAGKLIDRLIPEIVKRIPGLIATNLPIIANSAVSIISALGQGISENKDVLIESAFETISFLAGSLFEALPDILALGIDVVLALADGIVENVDEIVPVAVEAITTLALALTDPERIMLLVNAAISIMTALADSLTDEETIKKLTDAAPTIVSNVVTAIVEAAPDLLSAGVEILSQLFTSLTDPENLEIVGNAAMDIVNSIGQGIKDLFEDLWDIGEDIINKIWDGMKSAWRGAERWLGDTLRSALGIGPIQGGKAFLDFLNQQMPGFIPQTVIDGAHKMGLDYVPFDGYVAELHKGERILTKEEAENYEKKSVVQVIQNIYSEAKTAADLMEEALYEQEKAVWLGV